MFPISENHIPYTIVWCVQIYTADNPVDLFAIELHKLCIVRVSSPEKKNEIQIQNNCQHNPNRLSSFVNTEKLILWSIEIMILWGQPHH